MGRRGAGALILLFAVLAVLIPVAATPQFDGHAAPISIPAPPAVGDCVTEPFQPHPKYAEGATIADTYPYIASDPCTGTRYAEVVRIIEDPLVPIAFGTDAGFTVDDTNLGICSLAVSDYAGAAVEYERLGTIWRPSMFLLSALSGPSPLQYAAGQRWVACYTGVAFGSDPADPTPATGSLRNAVSTGEGRDQTGACTDGTGDGSFRTGDCQYPHSTQIMASGGTPGAPTTVDLIRQSCRDVLGTLTGLVDVTAGGRLTVLVSVRDSAGQRVEVDPVLPDSSAACGLTTTDGTATLSGGLVGLGSRPIPWA